MKYSNYYLKEIAAKITENYKKADFSLLEKALALAQRGQEKIDNRPKEVHVLNTAFILAESGLDEQTVIAGLLHHVLSEKTVSKEEMEKEFGKEITELVESSIKIEETENKNLEKVNSEILTKLILSTAKDIRSLFVRLAARLESMRALETLSEETQKRISKTTIEIYVPICHKLGLHKMRWELEDLAMKKLDRQAYDKVKTEIKLTREEREKLADKIAKEIEKMLRQKKIECVVYGRAKNFYRINKKMTEQNKKISEIFDLTAVRVLCNTEKECYAALSAIQEKFETIPKEFNDYITNPKPNGYQSIHACIIFEGTTAEVQIRTWEMHNTAEDGLAAHWQYKQYKKDKLFDPRLSIAKQLTEWQQTTDRKEIIDSMKINFEGNKIFVFTPKNELIELEDGSTPIDFAFALHSDLGMKCERAKVNGKIVTLDYKLETGDTVEITTSDKQKPKQQWLAIVKTEKAKQRIRSALEIQAVGDKPKNILQRIKKIFDFSARIKNLARTAKCCSPLPGDKIVGVRTTKRKIVIHRADCKNIVGLPENKKVAVSDELFEKGHYEVTLSIIADNRPGLLPEILNAITAFNSTTTSTNAKLLQNNTMQCTLNIKIKSLQELEKLLERINKIKGVKKADRA